MKPTDNNYIKGRGAQINTPNPFDACHKEWHQPLWNDQEELSRLKKTQHIPTYPKTILNKVESPDIGMGYSLNPYQGCEHGCIYCYARNTHTYWGYSAGLEFEQKILIKKTAPQLLEKKITHAHWRPAPIMLSGNTDCYQPAEKTYCITRQILEILWKYRHPVGIITKNSLILRDIDLLEKMALKNLVHVSISLTTPNESLGRRLEPRTSTFINRLKTIRELTEKGIPVRAMMAPIIPSLNDTEIFNIARSASNAGALDFSHIIIRLNGDVAVLFKDWIRKNFPEKADRVLNQVKNCHGGSLNDSRFGIRMKGEGNIAYMISQQVKNARAKYFEHKQMPSYDLSHYRKNDQNVQMRLF